MVLTLLAAVDQTLGIGYQGKLLWRDCRNLARFQRTTTGHPVIMSRGTWDSLPARFRPLPERSNIVLTRSRWAAHGATTCSRIDNALLIAAGRPGNEEVFVIGGESAYSSYLPLAHRIMLTHIEHTFRADKFFPKFSCYDWQQKYCSETFTDRQGIRFIFKTYERIE